MHTLIYAIFIVTLFFTSGCDAPETSSQTAPTGAITRMLIFTKTAGYRHESIEVGTEIFRELARKQGVETDHTEDAAAFNAERLSQYQIIAFLNTTGDVLNETQQSVFEAYIRGGGHFYGIHSAADTEHDWPFYGELVGGYFKNHPLDPNIRRGKIEVLVRDHPSTRMLDSTWVRQEEWYNYTHFGQHLHPLLNLDENSYEGGENGAYHPIAWQHEKWGGKAFYTGGGHLADAFREPLFQQHLAGGLEYLLQSE